MSAMQWLPRAMLIALLLLAAGEAGYSDDSPLAPTPLKGWPVEIDNPIYSSPAYGDLDGDGCLEVVVGVPVGRSTYSSGKYYAWHHDGTLLSGWPVVTTYPVASSPAIADLDDDGVEEVIGASLGFRELYAWDHSGNVLDGFPVDISNGIHIWQGGAYMLDSSPAIGDIDGDLAKDIIIASCKSLWVVDAGGQPLQGWPLLFPATHTGYSDVALGDVDNDTQPEIVVAFGYEENLYPYTRHSYVYVFRSDGTLLNNHWPKELTNKNLGNVRNSPVLANLDDDEDLEIVMASDAHWQSGTLATLHAWNLDGSDLFPPLSIPSDWYYVSGLTLADLDNDSVPEILMGAGNNRFIVVDATGSILYQNNAVIRGGATPVVGRLDSTPDPGIVTGGYYGDLYAWYGDGSSIPGFGYTAGDFISTSPALADLDFNGQTELIVSSTDRKVYVWELDAAHDPDTIEWAMFRHDPWHTGRYEGGGFSKGLYCDSYTISVSIGGTINFFLTAGISNANRNYFLLASVTGTIPGTAFPHVTLPLNWDAFTDIVLSLANTPVMQNFNDTLDASGNGTARLNTMGPLPPSAVGITLYFAHLLYYPIDFASNPVAIKIVP